MIYVYGYTFRESNASILIFASVINEVQLLKKRICSCRSKFFPLRVETILEGLNCIRKQTESHLSGLPGSNGRKTC